jgi:hypothetical protein
MDKVNREGIDVIPALSAWLESTPLSATIQNVSWIIPLGQIIHILCLSIVLSSVVLVDSRLLGFGARRLSIGGMSARFMPWIWTALIIMAISGAVLVIGEPRRDLLNPVFRLKMLLLVGAVVVTVLFQRAVQRNARFWDENPTRRLSARLVAVVSLALWIAIAVCWRLIAYFTMG